VSLSTQEYKREPANVMPETSLPRTSILSRGLRERVEIPRVTPYYRIWYKLWLDKSPDSVQTRPIYGVHYDWPNVSCDWDIFETSSENFGTSQTLSLLRSLLCKLEETNDPESFVTGSVIKGF